MKNTQRMFMALILTTVMTASTWAVATATKMDSANIRQSEKQMQAVEDIQVANNLTEVSDFVMGSLSKNIPNSGTVTINKSCTVYIVFYAKSTSGTGAATYKVTIGGRTTYVTADGVSRTYPLGSFSKGTYNYKIEYNAGSTATYAFGMQLIG